MPYFLTNEQYGLSSDVQVSDMHMQSIDNEINTQNASLCGYCK
jgi:hypothetical protein